MSHRSITRLAMALTLHFILTLFVIDLVYGNDSEPTSSNLLDFARSLYYEELGCKSGSGSRFDCPNTDINVNVTDSCLFGSQLYPIGAKLEDEKTIGMCIAQCVCKTLVNDLLVNVQTNFN